MAEKKRQLRLGVFQRANTHHIAAWRHPGARADLADGVALRENAESTEAISRSGRADGFNIMPPYLPGGLDDFITLVLPEPRRRGLFRTDDEGHSLRENLGLARPENQFAVTRGVALRA